MGRRNPKPVRKFIISYWGVSKVESTTVLGVSIAYVGGFYSVLDAEGDVVFEIPKETFVKLERKDALSNEQREASGKVMFLS